MNKIFVDTNVFDDLYRNGAAAGDIAIIFEQIRRKTIVGCTSPKTMMDICYLIQGEKGTKEAYRRLKQIYSLFEITSQTAAEVREAFMLDWTDFEDAMQMASADRQELTKSLRWIRNSETRTGRTFGLLRIYEHISPNGAKHFHFRKTWLFVQSTTTDRVKNHCQGRFVDHRLLD